MSWDSDHEESRVAHNEEQNSTKAGDVENLLMKASADERTGACLESGSLGVLVQDTDLACREGVLDVHENDTEYEDLGALRELIKAISVAPGSGEQDYEKAMQSLKFTLFNAARVDNVSMYKVILSCLGDLDIGLSTFGDFQMTSLQSALTLGSFKCARYLATVIQDVNMCDLCSLSSFDRETFQILFDRGFKIENCPCQGMCSLRDCIVFQKEKMVELCLENGCVANEPAGLMEMNEAHPSRNLEYDDFTPLLCAVLYGNLETVKILLEHNAEIITEEAYDMSPIEAAVYVAKPCMLEVILKAYKLSIEGEGQPGWEAFRNDVQHSLNIAVTLKTTPSLLQCVDILLDFGATVNGVDAKGVLPILASVQNGNEHSLCLLLQRGSDVNAVGNVEKYGSLRQQLSPFRLATELSDDNILTILMKAGAIDQSEDGVSEDVQKRITRCKKSFSLADWSRLSVRKQIQPFSGQNSVKELEIPLVLKQFLNMMY